MNQLSLQNKKIIVTGGSRGIGKSLVQDLAENGAIVAFSYSSNEAAANETLKSLPGQNHFCFQMNTADPESVEQQMKQVCDRLGQVDGLVNNAGVTKDQLLMKMKLQEWDQVIDTNLRGAFLTIQAVSRIMMKQRQGSIVNIGSIIGLTGNAGQTNYAASKAGMIGLTKSCALELASRGIRVNVVAPGYIQTEMTDVLSEEIKAKILEKIPLKFIGQPQHVASAVRFLLSDQASYMTGQTLSVNGGMFMN
ncbi:MAG: 3-oxoacyl-[acyl-carrier-protein] reductase [Pseudobdellovibrionaceae bacterium]